MRDVLLDHMLQRESPVSQPQKHMPHEWSAVSAAAAYLVCGARVGAADLHCHLLDAAAWIRVVGEVNHSELSSAQPTLVVDRRSVQLNVKQEKCAVSQMQSPKFVTLSIQRLSGASGASRTEGSELDTGEVDRKKAAKDVRQRGQQKRGRNEC